MLDRPPPFVPGDVEGALGARAQPSPDPTGAGARFGTIAGIARHAFPRAPMELLQRALVTTRRGVEGDHRGALKPGGKRQVTLMERRDWLVACGDLGLAIPWEQRRVNLLVDDFDLPQLAGARLRIGDVLLEVTVECDPCQRMDELAEGLQAALRPDWRGGVCARVLADGEIAVGDRITIDFLPD